MGKRKLFTPWKTMNIQDKKRLYSRQEASLKNQSKTPNDEETLFINKIERGTGKYKGKSPLKCFNCGRIGHFVSKCTYTKQDENE